MTPSFSVRKALNQACLLLISSLFFHISVFAQGCQFDVTVNKQDVSCPGANDGQINLLFSVGAEELTKVRVLWSVPAADTDFSLSGLAPGVYSVTITDSGELCTQDTISINSPAPLAINCFVLNDVSVAGGQDGVAKVDCSNGLPPYNILWSGPTTGSLLAATPGLNSINNLPAGFYSVTVTDNCGTSNCSFTVREPLCDNLVSVETDNPSCFGAADARIFFTPNPLYNERTFSYQWLNDGLITASPFRNQLSAGQYQIIVTDDTGCRDTISEALTGQVEMTIRIDTIIQDEFVVYGGQGEIQGRIVNGFPPYNITWSNSVTTMDFNGLNSSGFTFTNLEKDTYNIAVTDERGCNSSTTVIVGSRFFAPRNTAFILDFTQVPDMDTSKIRPFMDTLRSQEAILIDTCHCEFGAWLLQSWISGPSDIIIIDNTPPQGAQSSTKSDGNGWFGGITTPPLEGRKVADAFGNCSYTPGQGNGPDYRVRVAIIDSGVNLRYAGQPNSGHPALSGLDWVNDEADGKDCIAGDVNGYDFVNKTATVIDSVGHGTHIAGAIANLFPDNIHMEIMNLKVYDKGQQGNVFGLACAIHYAVSHNAQVINLSLGYYSQYPFEPLYNALKRAEENEILVVLSAGNDALNIDSLLLVGSSPLRWPASFKSDHIKTGGGKPLEPLNKNLLVVASTHETTNGFLENTYTNWGNTLVDIATNGMNTSTHLDSTYVTLKGTSMATANVSREAALIRAYDKSIPPDSIIHKMIHANKPFSELENKGIKAQGSLDIPKLYASIPIDTTVTPSGRIFVHSPSGSRVSLTLKKTNNVVGPKSKYDILLGDGSIFYDDVRIVVTGGSPLRTQYEATFCSTNRITWFGQDNNGLQIAQEGNYFIRVFINGDATSPNTMPVVINN